MEKLEDHPYQMLSVAANLYNHGLIVQAEIVCKQLFIKAPDNTESLALLGSIYLKKGMIKKAILALCKSLAIEPKNHGDKINLGNALAAQGKLDEDIISYKTAQQQSYCPETYNNLGKALTRYGDLDNAIASYISAVKLNPNYPDAYNSLGVAFRCKGMLDPALNSFKKVLELIPNHPRANINLAMLLLLKGEYKDGWEKYEYRTLKNSDASSISNNHNCKRWDGKPLGTNDQLLLTSEVGLGDTLHFMRYALHLRAKGIKVKLSAQIDLHELIKISAIDPSPLSPEESKSVKTGYWLPLLSLPRYLDVSPENVIIKKPYIQTSQKLIRKWERLLLNEIRPIIGINWQGNPRNEELNLMGRSIPLNSFSPIAKDKNVTIVSLQKGFGSEQLSQECSFINRFAKCQQDINDTSDFLETAAIMHNCDLIITSDTSIAHLAGGMGRPTWLLLHETPDWRWGINAEKTFWYPSIRIFRKQQPCNWEKLLQRVANELHEQYPGIK